MELRRSRSALDQLQDEWEGCPAAEPSRWGLLRLHLHKRTLARAAAQKPKHTLTRAASVPASQPDSGPRRQLQRSASVPSIPGHVSMKDLPPLLSGPLGRAASRTVLTPPEWRPEQDPAVRHGRLPNGVRYLVRLNRHPSQEIQLRTVVLAGSLQETEAQRGLAHTLEHCVFRGTASFADGQIDRFMKAIGAAPGADNNAWTGHEMTSYKLNVPWRSDDPSRGGDASRTALRMLSEMMFGASLDEEMVGVERRVVLEELRQHSALGSKMVELLLTGLTHSTRSPAGSPQVVASADSAALRRFYSTWYQPSRVTVIAVGDFESADDMVAMIADEFGSVPAPSAPPPELPCCADVWAGATEGQQLVFVQPCASDMPGVANLVIAVRRKNEPSDCYSIEHDIDALLGGLVTTVLCQRLHRLQRQTAACEILDLELKARHIELMAIHSQTEERTEAVLDQTRIVLTELERIRRFGLSDSELLELGTFYENILMTMVERRDSQSSSAHVEELESVVWQGDKALPQRCDKDYVMAAWKRMKPSFSRSQVQRLVNDRTDTVLALFTDCVSKAEVETLWEQVKSSELEQCADELCELSSLDQFPQECLLPAGQATELPCTAVQDRQWQLSNGMLVRYEPHDTVLLESDNIQTVWGASLRLVGNPGITALAQGHKSVIAARLSCSIALMVGLAGFKIEQLERFMLNCLVMIEECETNADSRYMKINLPMHRMALTFELLHHLFVVPVRVPLPEEIESIKEALKATNVRQGQDHSMDSQVQQLLWKNNPLFTQITVEDIEQCDFAEAIEFFNTTLFNDPAQFTVIITCEKLSSDEIQEMVHQMERYLASIPRCTAEQTSAPSTRAAPASLPALEPAAVTPDVTIPEFPPGITYKVFAHGSMQCAKVQMFWPASLGPLLSIQTERRPTWCPEELELELRVMQARLQSHVLRIVLADLLNQHLRSEAGLVYGVGVDLIENHDATCLWVVAGTVLSTIGAVVEFECRVLAVIEALSCGTIPLQGVIEAAIANLMKEAHFSKTNSGGLFGMCRRLGNAKALCEDLQRLPECWFVSLFSLNFLASGSAMTCVELPEEHQSLQEELESVSARLQEHRTRAIALTAQCFSLTESSRSGNVATADKRLDGLNKSDRVGIATAIEYAKCLTQLRRVSPDALCGMQTQIQQLASNRTWEAHADTEIPRPNIASSDGAQDVESMKNICARPDGALFGRCTCFVVRPDSSVLFKQGSTAECLAALVPSPGSTSYLLRANEDEGSTTQESPSTPQPAKDAREQPASPRSPRSRTPRSPKNLCVNYQEDPKDEARAARVGEFSPPTSPCSSSKADITKLWKPVLEGPRAAWLLL